MDASAESLSRLQTRFRNAHGYELNLAHPKTFMEKLQWLKLYGRLDRLAKYVDKYDVREFVRQKLGESYLIPLIGVYTRADEIPYTSLPNAFVMKATHGSGWNLIVHDKSVLDWTAVQHQINSWLKMNYYDIGGEPNYRALKGRVLIEKYMAEPFNSLLDYRFFCFHGIPRYIKVHGRQNGEERHDMFDLNWTQLPVRYGSTAGFKPPVERPKNLQEMIDVSQQLSESFSFVRVDLYDIGSQVYFGELTFTPSNGFTRLYPVEFDHEMGQWLDITRI